MKPSKLLLDSTTLPLDAILQQAVSENLDTASQAWIFLGSVSPQRPEAGIFLIGLMQVHRDDLAKMTVLVQAVCMYPSEAAAQALKNEFLRVVSGPSTRTYLNEVFRALKGMRPLFGIPAMRSLAEDRMVSIRWRRRFVEAIAEATPSEYW